MDTSILTYFKYIYKSRWCNNNHLECREIETRKNNSQKWYK
jgi:hypothetical protein